MAATDEGIRDLYRAERRTLERTVARIVGDQQAEDLVHDAFVAYLHHAPEADRPGAWLSRVARNRALNEARRARPLPLTDAADDRARPAHLGDPAEEAERDAIRALVRAALERLPERSLEALRLRFEEGLGYPDIARALGCRIEQAYVVVHRATRRLGTEVVRQLAEAHGASECAPALAHMAGIGEPDGATHADGPCARCRPAWDEISALRSVTAIFPSISVEGIARRISPLRRLAGEVAAHVPVAAEPLGRVASGIVALGLAAATIAGPSGTAPTPAPSGIAEKVPAVSGAAPAKAARRGATVTQKQESARTPKEAGGVRDPAFSAGGASVTRDDDSTRAEVQRDGPGWSSATVCEPLEPCPPPPSP